MPRVTIEERLAALETTAVHAQRQRERIHEDLVDSTRRATDERREMLEKFSTEIGELRGMITSWNDRQTGLTVELAVVGNRLESLAKDLRSVRDELRSFENASLWDQRLARVTIALGGAGATGGIAWGLWQLFTSM